MSVLIKDMEIPTSCTMCWLNTFCGVWNIETVKHKGFNKRLDACPLTELIRCKDCKNWEADEDEQCMYCGEGILPVTEACMGYGFCSMAEPKETE